MPFGVKCVVSISKNDREGKQCLTQDAGWSGIFVGYGISTGHGGAYRIYDPVRKKVMRVSINKCTMDLTCYPWRSRKEWQAKKIDLPVSIAPTAEALLDEEEIEKYCFNDDMLREATDQLSSQFNHTEEPFTKDSGEHTDMGGRSDGDNNYNSNLPPDEPELKLEEPNLSSLPELESMTPSRTPHAEEQEADAIVAGEEEKHPR